MKEFFVINLSTAFVIFIATFIFTIVCFKRRDLISWPLGYISASLSEVFRLLSRELYDLLEIIGITFSALSVLLFIIAVSHEYYKTFLQNKNLSVKHGSIPVILLIFHHHIASIGLQLIIAFLLIIALFLSFRIYLKKRTPTHAFMFFILSTGLLQLIASLIRDQGLLGAEEFFEFSRIVMATIMLITGIVVNIEEKILKSERKYRLAYNRAEFYKDLFIHDINNILQNLQFSLDIIAQNSENLQNKEIITDLIKIAEGQVNRGSELGLNVKKLSDLEIGAIKSEEISLINALSKTVDKIKREFSDEVIEINIDCKLDNIIINANVLIEDVFSIILNNAIKYNNNPIKQILIKISRMSKNNGNDIKIEFIDNGIGIPDLMKRSIFQPFHEKTEDFKRIGLGLLLVNAIIGNLSGKIWVEDRVQDDYKKGSNFIILISEA